MSGHWKVSCRSKTNRTITLQLRKETDGKYQLDQRRQTDKDKYILITETLKDQTTLVATRRLLLLNRKDYLIPHNNT